ncbi:hypothetical protein GALMADRAFT_148158 [Galerina marginata CBS 339.88]|uniref:Uncharacterized protein n=1 Tax=Galerina marginata (strain CBS 339.88) TaxID=685588 RepID=A0A067S5L3_GALM3|nr:hypothetical protein GALMADRAFT_148158 [Galerina marginata CBS 339.88]
MRLTAITLTIASFFAITVAAASAPISMKRTAIEDPNPVVELGPICECPCCHSFGGKLFCC